MKLLEYVEHARKKGIPLTTTDVDIYMDLYASRETCLEYYSTCEINDLDPEEILSKSVEYLDSREHCCS